MNKALLLEKLGMTEKAMKSAMISGEAILEAFGNDNSSVDKPTLKSGDWNQLLFQMADAINSEMSCIATDFEFGISGSEICVEEIELDTEYLMGTLESVLEDYLNKE